MTALVVGDFASERHALLEVMLRNANLPGNFYPFSDDLQSLLTGPREPQMLLVDASFSGLRGFISRVRSHAVGFSLPLIGLLPSVEEDQVIRAYMAGADDVLGWSDYEGLVQRVDLLRDFSPKVRPPCTRGSALVVHHVDQRRVILGRTLRLAGFSVDFASFPDEVAKRDYDLVVVELDHREAPVAFYKALHHALGHSTACVLTARTRTQRELHDLRVSAQVIPSLTVIDETDAADRLLFMSNELFAGDAINLRESQRLAYESICMFRLAGAQHACVGSTYNISREGLYVRTMVPPPPDQEVWIEIRPYKNSCLVHLRARTVWCPTLEAGKPRSAPSGFGVRLIEDASPTRDLEVFRSAYDALCFDIS